MNRNQSRPVLAMPRGQRGCAVDDSKANASDGLCPLYHPGPGGPLGSGEEATAPT